MQMIQNIGRKHEMISELLSTFGEEKLHQSLLYQRDVILMTNDQDETRHEGHDYNDNVLHEQFVHEQLVLELDRDISHCSSSIEQDKQHDHENAQMHDDILHHEDMNIEQTIQAFESLNRNSDSESSQSNANWTNCDWYNEPPDSSEDDLNENTDTDDGIIDFIDVVGANTDLIAFLKKQRATIARLRARIVRLNTLLAQQTMETALAKRDLQDIYDQHDEHRVSDDDSTDLHDETATVLMDTLGDMSFLLQPNSDITVGLAQLPQGKRVNFLIEPSGFPETGMTFSQQPKVQKELEIQLARIKEHKNSDAELWMYFDSGASRSVISTESPIRKHLKALVPAYGSCSIGNGTPLQYIEKGTVYDNLEITVVQDLKYDLFSSVNAAKNGLTSIIDYDLKTGKNNSYTVNKLSGAITPLVERGRGILELPLHLMLLPGTCLATTHTESTTSKEQQEEEQWWKDHPHGPQHLLDKYEAAVLLQPANHNPDVLPPNTVSMFWHYYDDKSFDPHCRNNNQHEYALFTFDVLKSLNERERDFLIHARLGHLPRKSILQMIKNGTTGIKDYSGKFKELCKPCLQAKQRAENHGREHKRHPDGRPGEHLHSDLAVVSTLDINGNKYVLTVIDEISSEIVVALLKRKTAEDVCNICKKIQKLILARTGHKLLTWQFDRGTEFLNSTFESWLKMDLGVQQRFSNVEHPWENGKAERSFQTLFSLSRSMLKHADLPDRLWGKAILHSVYIANRSPAASLGGIAPLQFRTKTPIDLSHMRVFGSPAQIFLRSTIRNDTKLSDRSISGTLVGISDKGNGYIFLVRKLTKLVELELVEIDSKDVKFNETFADIRERKGKLTTAHEIEPDLHDEQRHDNTNVNKGDDNATHDDSKNDDAEQNDDEADNDVRQQRTKRQRAQRVFLLPGTHTELNIRKQTYANVCLEPLMDFNDTVLMLDCMDAQTSNETILMKELELLNACTYNDDDNDVLLATLLNTNAVNLVNLNTPDPKTQGEINKMHPIDAKRFNDATIAEVDGMKIKQVFANTTMDELPEGTPIYQSVVNWTSKTNLGVYVKTKCRICFGGHRYDKSFSDTFAPTVNFCTVLIVICLSAMFQWYLGSLDYSQAYLNADIDELCVMRAPIAVREYNSKGKEYFWRMKKAIYGHPKASRLWADCLHKKLQELGYHQFLTDQCVYGRWNNWDPDKFSDNMIPKTSSFTFLLIHSDDIIIVSHDEQIMNNAKAELLQAFDGTDNGNLKSFCGVEIKMSEDKISLSMEYYWNKLMKKFAVNVSDIESSPLKTKIKRSECPKEPDEKLKNSYLQIIGSIIYGYTHCRLDLAFPVNMMTRVMHSPAEQHYHLLKKLLFYINKTKNWTLNFYKDDSMYYGMDFIFFSNVDSAHADDEESHRSSGGWFFFLRKGQGAIAAKSGQTKDIPLSSTESETIWGNSAAMQGAFIKQFLDETRLFKSTSFELHEDSQPMINAQKRNVSQSRFKHMKTKHHYIRKLIFDGWCKLIKIPTKMNTADMATKILPATTVSIFSKIVLGLQDTLECAPESEDSAILI